MQVLVDEIEAKIIALLQDEQGATVFAHHLALLLSREPELAARFLSDPQPLTAQEQELAAKLGIGTCEPAETKAKEVVALNQYFEERRKLLADALSLSEVAGMLRVSRQTAHHRAHRGQLLAMMDNNALKFPTWQFDPNAPDGVVPGLDKVLAALKCGTLTKLAWLSGANKVFDGRSPIDVLKEGRLDEVLAEAVGVGVAQ